MLAESSISSVTALHAGICSRHFFQCLSPAASDIDDLVARFVKCLGKPLPNARAAAGDKDGVTSDIHTVSSRFMAGFPD